MRTPIFLSRQEVRSQLGISLPTLERRLEDGTIPYVRIGRRILIPAEAMENLKDQAYQAGGQK